MIDRIVGLVAPGPGDKLLEIGPGGGALSIPLLDRAPALYVALEKDRAWALALKRRRPEAGVVETDALRFVWERLSGDFKVAGNLPYNVASPMLWEFASRAKYVRGVFMVQKEVALRLAAGPGGRDYGLLSVWVQSFATVKRVFDVKPGSFTPPPKVDSSVFTLTPRTDAPGFDPVALSATIKTAFGQRRKQLAGIFRDADFDVRAWLASHGLPETARPEILPVDVFHEFSRLLHSAG